MTESLFSINRFRVIFVFSFMAWAALQSYIIHGFGFAKGVAITDGILSNAVLVSACLLISNTLRFYLPYQNRYIFLSAITVFFSLTSLLLSSTVLMLWHQNIEGYNRFFTQSIPVRFAFSFLLLGAVVLMNVLWHTLQQQQENEKRKSEAEKLSKDAELFRLRQQLQPHFLFNSLNSINALIVQHPQQARTMIQQLSDFLRGTLQRDEKQWVTLEQEMEQLGLYLDIEKVRFGHRLQTSIEMDETCLKLRLPALLLQPVVENAIKFGLYDTTSDITIVIRTWQQNNNLVVQVSNPYDTATAAGQKGTGFGLPSVRRRLFLLFSRHDLLQTNAENQIFTTKITIPQIA